MVSTGLHRCRCPMASTPAVATDSSGSALSASRRLLHIYIPYTYTIYCVYRYRYYPNIPYIYIYEYNIIPIRLVTRNFLRFLFATCLETSWNHAFASCGKAVWGQWDAKALKAPDCNWNTFEYLADQTANQEVANCENAPGHIVMCHCLLGTQAKHGSLMQCWLIWASKWTSKHGLPRWRKLQVGSLT